MRSIEVPQHSVHKSLAFLYERFGCKFPLTFNFKVIKLVAFSFVRSFASQQQNIHDQIDFSLANSKQQTLK